MKYLSKMLNNIKSWQWYDWSKNIQAAIAFTVALVCVGYAATIGILEFFLAAITVFAILTAAGYLIIKDRKLAHCFVIFICACWGGFCHICRRRVQGCSELFRHLHIVLCDDVGY